MQIRLTGNKLILILLLLFPISTLLQGFGIFNNLNRIIIFLMMGGLLVSFFLDSFTILSCIYMIGGLVLSCLAIYLTKGAPYYINTYIFFPFWIIFFSYLIQNYRELMKGMCERLKLLRGIVYVWEAIVVVSLFFSRCYVEEWGDRYFQSFSNSPHRFAGTCLEILAYVSILFILDRRKKDLLLFILPVIGLFVCGARTYLAIGILFVLAFYYIMCQNKKLFYITIIPVLVGIAGLILITPIGTKMVYTLKGNGYYGYWATLTNGRSMFWVDDIKGFWQLPFGKKLIGNGANYIYDLNIAGTAGRMLWAHNDFINLLCSNGILGLLLYLAVFFYFTSHFKVKNTKFAKFPLFAFYVICGFNAFFNMLYTYTSAVLVVPFIFFVLYTLPQEYLENEYAERKMGE